MAKRQQPRVPLPAVISLPDTKRTIQVNHCKTPDCVDFGVPARHEPGKLGPSADRDMAYKLHTTAKGKIPAVRCKACLDLPPIKRNAAIAAEVERLAGESGIWTLEESAACRNDECDNHTRQIGFHPEEVPNEKVAAFPSTSTAHGRRVTASRARRRRETDLARRPASRGA